MLVLLSVRCCVLNFNQNLTVLHSSWSRSSTKQMHWKSQGADGGEGGGM